MDCGRVTARSSASKADQVPFCLRELGEQRGLIWGPQVPQASAHKIQGGLCSKWCQLALGHGWRVPGGSAHLSAVPDSSPFPHFTGSARVWSPCLSPHLSFLRVGTWPVLFTVLVPAPRTHSRCSTNILWNGMGARMEVMETTSWMRTWHEVVAIQKLWLWARDSPGGKVSWRE